MDPVSLIISSLAAGTAAGFKETAAAAVKDAYAGIRSRIRSFLAERGSELVLDRYEDAPATWEEPLRAELVASGVSGDRDLMDAIGAFLELLNSQAPVARFQTHVEGGVKGFVQGDHNTVTMNFDDPAEPSR